MVRINATTVCVADATSPNSCHSTGSCDNIYLRSSQLLVLWGVPTLSMRCLVTGGAGFIGSHLVDHLLSLGHQVRVLDNLDSGKLANLEAVSKRIEFVEGDVRELATVAKGGG